LHSCKNIKNVIEQEGIFKKFSLLLNLCQKEKNADCKSANPKIKSVSAAYNRRMVNIV
jgi:hypothetical protein